MKKALLVVIIFAMLLCGCHGAARDFGGTMSIELPPGQKLELITWKEDTLWYLCRPMREGEKAETHTYQADSEWGVFEGTVYVIEKEAE